MAAGGDHQRRHVEARQETEAGRVHVERQTVPGGNAELPRDQRRGNGNGIVGNCAREDQKVDRGRCEAGFAQRVPCGTGRKLVLRLRLANEPLPDAAIRLEPSVRLSQLAIESGRADLLPRQARPCSAQAERNCRHSTSDSRGIALNYRMRPAVATRDRCLRTRALSHQEKGFYGRPGRSQDESGGRRSVASLAHHCPTGRRFISSRSSRMASNCVPNPFQSPAFNRSTAWL